MVLLNPEARSQSVSSFESGCNRLLLPVFFYTLSPSPVWGALIFIYIFSTTYVFFSSFSVDTPIPFALCGG